MERRCRLSTVQAEQAIGYVHTWHKAPLLVPQVYPLPRLASCVPHVSSSPSARSETARRASFADALFTQGLMP